MTLAYLDTSVIAYPVFARRHSSGELGGEQHDQIMAVYRRAGTLVAHPRLRAMHARHLALVLDARAHEDIRFLTFDTDLAAVAGVLLSKQEMA